MDIAKSGSLTPCPANFDTQLIRTIIACKWSLTVVDDIEFIRLILCANKDQKLPSSSTVTNRILKLREVSEKAIIRRLPPAPQKVAIVLDGWSAPRRDGFLAIKAYWVTDWHMREALIGFEPCYGAHSGADLAKIVIDRLTYFKIEERVIAFTTDNASNNKTMSESVNSAIESLCNQVGIVNEIALCPCISHVIQLGCNGLLTDIKIRPKKDEFVKNWLEEEERVAMALARTEIPANTQRGVSLPLVIPFNCVDLISTPVAQIPVPGSFLVVC
jgi:hypothetical protein